jgi:hypothetical protein
VQITLLPGVLPNEAIRGLLMHSKVRSVDFDQQCLEEQVALRERIEAAASSCPASTCAIGSDLTTEDARLLRPGPDDGAEPQPEASVGLQVVLQR